MRIHSDITQRDFLKVAQVFNWATKKHFVVWFTGENRERHFRIETLLKRLSDNGRLRVANYGKKLVYITPRRKNLDNYQILHGLGVTEGLVRLVVSDRSATIIPERKFKAKARPEFGLVYKDSMLMYEFCTRDNAKRLDVLRRKVNAYNSYLKEKQMVLFVMQLTRDEVKSVINRLKPAGPFMFTDLTTFMEVPYGEQLTAKIYLWEDGNEYQLRPG